MKNKILVVDDDYSVRGVLVEALSRKGFEVISAVDGLAGLETLRNNPDVALLISDIEMPKMLGPELIRKAKEERPELPTILMTGNSKLANQGANELLRKPFSLVDLYFIVGKLIPPPMPPATL